MRDLLARNRISTGLTIMPEAPELYLIREWLEPRLVGRRVDGVSVLRPLVVRNMLDAPMEDALVGRSFESVGRDGKLLIFGLDGGVSIVVSPMLVGELRLVSCGERVVAATVLELAIAGGLSLRYLDSRRMGQVYVLRTVELSTIGRLERQGPDVIDAPMSYEELRAGLRSFRGELKSVLTGGRLLGGIGNAYADDILWSAKLYPFVKVSRMSEDDFRRLHEALMTVPRSSVDVLRDVLDREGLTPRKYRSVLRVHGKSGLPCPDCGTRISSVKLRRRETNFCRACQPGTLVGS